MKYCLTILLAFSSLLSFSQTVKSSKTNSRKTVSFVTTLDIANLTKDGIYLNGYVVNIEARQAKKLDGKKIRVTGKVTIVKGIGKYVPGEPAEQGRSGDSKHILSPKIEVIEG